MKKEILLALMLVLSTVSLSLAVQNVGPDQFTWVRDSGYAQDQGQKSYDIEYSSCYSLTDTPNVVTFAVKRTYTDWGRQYFRIPNVAFDVCSYHINLNTGMYMVYDEKGYNSNGAQISIKLPREGWKVPNPGSFVEHFVDLARHSSPCR